MFADVMMFVICICAIWFIVAMAKHKEDDYEDVIEDEEDEGGMSGL